MWAWPAGKSLTAGLDRCRPARILQKAGQLGVARELAGHEHAQCHGAYGEQTEQEDDEHGSLSGECRYLNIGVNPEISMF